MKYLHIMHNDKFIKDYIKFINKNLDMEEHFFFIFSREDINDKRFENFKNIEIIKIEKKILNYLKLIKVYRHLYELAVISEKIIVHSLLEIRVVMFFNLFKKLTRKSYWYIWGGDLYDYIYSNTSIKRKIHYIVSRKIKSMFKGYITHIRGDYELAQKWYSAKGKYLECLMYPSNLYKEVKLKEEKKEYLAIQIGNSATFTNNHFEIFEKLKKFKNKNIKIYCPLSYGNKKYAEKVVKKGKNIFGEKLILMTEFLEYPKYLEFLSQIDIAIFAHDRQQAVGNITSLLSMKKTVYLKKEVTTYDMLEELGVKIKLFDNLDSLEIFEEEVLEKNREIIKERFSEKRLIEDLEKIFND